MLTIRVLQRECCADTEIEYFLFIYELQQAIAIVERDIKYRPPNSVDGFPVIFLHNSLAVAEIERKLAIKQLAKFGVNILDFPRWYQWWLNYFYSLNDVELVDLEKTRLNGLDISEWHPSGHW